LGTVHLDLQAIASGVWNGFVVGLGTVVRGIDLVLPGRLIN
jgi:asparagine synthase (glutamine-hydrolysing)